MIGRLRGSIIIKQVPQVLIECHGVGYEVETSMTTFFKLPEVGQEVILFTHFIVREDAQMLFGFHDETERALFRTLIKVNGVGPKLAITILSSIQPDSFVLSIRNNDTATLTSIPGIGKKTAERLLVEMRDKLDQWHEIHTHDLNLSQDKNVNHYQAEKEALSALVALGYKPQEASRAFARIDNKSTLTSEELIRLALQKMVTHD